MTRIYQSLLKTDKIKLFQKCQELLVKNHPNSEFIVRRTLFNKRPNTLESLVKLYTQFNGSVYMDDNSLIFFKIFNISEGIEELYRKYNKESESGNTIFIVWATYNNKANIKDIIDNELMGEISQIAFSRNGKFRIYNIAQFVTKF